MSDIITVGFDLAKNVFQVHRADRFRCRRGLPERRIDQAAHRPHSQHHNKSRLIMPSGHQGVYTSLTDVTRAEELGGASGLSERLRTLQMARPHIGGIGRFARGERDYIFHDASQT